MAQSRPIPSSFYARPTLIVAQDLLGCRLEVRRGRSLCSGTIVETEAYIGEEDPACHARRGPTPRVQIMYGPAGHSFVYFTYGNHWMLNFVTEKPGFPAAVLIRAIEPAEGLPSMRRRRNVTREFDLTSGPGKLTAAMAISGRDNGLSLGGPRLAVFDTRSGGTRVNVRTSGRIGIFEGSERPWRFFADGSPWVSQYRKGTIKKRPQAVR